MNSSCSKESAGTGCAQIPAHSCRSSRQVSQIQANSWPPRGQARAYNSPQLDKVELKAQVVFDTCWRTLENKLKQIQSPREIVWLNGAPGSGKGVNTPFILTSRGLDRAISMSSLLTRHAGIQELMDKGELIPDTLVGDSLLDVIFSPDETDGSGLIVDGFPRTALQVDLVKLLHDKMNQLHLQHADGPDAWRFPRTSFKVVVLYVEQDESVRRQMLRAQQTALHNKRVEDAGTGELWNLRTTDTDVSKCKHRYEIFKAHYSTLLRLKQYFPFSLIDAMGTVDDTKAHILRELRYQSSLDLDDATYQSIKHLPLARHLVKSSRQQLVTRLDNYCRRQNEIFQEVLKFIELDVVPLLKRCSLAGHASLHTRNSLFDRSTNAADMLIDVLSDRGFSVAYLYDTQALPVSIDLNTGAIKTKQDGFHNFRITFEHAGVRGEAAPPSNGNSKRSSMSDPGANTAINQTFLPAHLMGRKAYHPRSNSSSQFGKNVSVKQYAQQLKPQQQPQQVSGLAPASEPIQEAYDAPFVK
ncbi:hypothetical protein WJX84_009096 [Apatococcus fuscideae]|uniref:adenylate kinase n=1 Tax=Apatococcus fuscideae TaxID=2026836 RepID=A0AAW1SBW9_9CHLO